LITPAGDRPSEPTRRGPVVGPRGAVTAKCPLRVGREPAPFCLLEAGFLALLVDLPCKSRTRRCWPRNSGEQAGEGWGRRCWFLEGRPFEKQSCPNNAPRLRGNWALTSCPKWRLEGNQTGGVIDKPRSAPRVPLEISYCMFECMTEGLRIINTQANPNFFKILRYGWEVAPQRSGWHCATFGETNQTGKVT
jgi:hypothetical protein